MALQETLKAISDPVRRKILVSLREKELSAGEIAQILQMTPPATSHHLQKLKYTGLVSERKEKNYIFYELNTSLFEELLLWLKQFEQRKEETSDEGNQKAVFDSDLPAAHR